MKKILPIIGILLVIALVPSIIGALLGTKGTGIFVVDFLLFGPILPIIALIAILWLLGMQPSESPRPSKEATPPEPALEEKPAEEQPIEPAVEESTAKEIEEETPEKEAVEEKSEEVESVCPTCGATVALDDEYCPHCGAEFEEESSE